MGLRDLLASQARPVEPDSTMPLPQVTYVPEGPYEFVVEVATDYRAVETRFISPEIRLSDALNSSVPTVEVDAVEGLPLPGAPQGAIISKASVLYMVPLAEPERPRGALWRVTAKHHIWLAIGPYEIAGIIHLDVGVDPLVALRLLDRTFVPITEARIEHTSGAVADYDVVLINRERAAILALSD
ncbi:MAG TPA: hypothetical protein VFB58_11890 [Chloroflexota bacterium]|nr:hypothetical protein [Chloroflexota bacterium]